MAFQIINKKYLLKNKLEVTYDITKDVTNDRAKQQENSDYDDCDQYEYECVLYQTLTFFTWKK